MFGSKLIGKTPGYDFAGTVEELGVGVPAGAHYIGQRVAGAVLDGRGAFAEYLVVDAGLIWEIPDGVGYEVAATQTAPALTACQMLWQSHDGFPTPEHPGDGQTPVRSLPRRLSRELMTALCRSWSGPRPVAWATG